MLVGALTLYTLGGTVQTFVGSGLKPNKYGLVLQLGLGLGLGLGNRFLFFSQCLYM